jgi:DNA-binding GntR family transcriptional regulator
LSNEDLRPQVPISGRAAGAAAPLHVQLVEGIRDLIVRGVLCDGEKVPEAALCSRFGVSRTPLREALKALAVEGYVELRPNRGAAVAPLDPAHLAALFEAKGALEHFIGLHAAQRIDADALARLERLHTDLMASHRQGEPGDYTRINQEIHQTLARAAGNEVVVQLYAGLQTKILRARYAINEHPAAIDRSLTEHEEIMAALRARARLDLAERLEQHNRKTGEAILRQIAERHGSAQTAG